MSMNEENSFIHAKKSLGQNFLISDHALETIIEAGNVTNTDIVVEVGPGKGALTQKLVKKAKKTIAIEKDDRLISVLTEMFANEIKNGSFELVHGDALEFDPTKYGLKSGEYKIIANIPYYITGSFFKKYFEEVVQPNTMVLMVQKEVAERIAREPKESILSLSVKAYGTPKYVHTVSKKLFRPVPNVDSAILAVYNINKNFFQKFSETFFFDIIKAGFAHKRKKLTSNLTEAVGKEKIHETFTQLNLSTDTRAEDLSLATWQQLISLLK